MSSFCGDERMTPSGRLARLTTSEARRAAVLGLVLLGLVIAAVAASGASAAGPSLGIVTASTDMTSTTGFTTAHATATSTVKPPASATGKHDTAPINTSGFGGRN